MRIVAFVTALTATASGCFGPRTTVILPSCADRVEMEGQHAREGDRRIILDHTLDPPFTRTQLTFQTRTPDGQKRVETIDAWNSRPDIGHLVVGGVFGFAGTALGLVAARDVYVEQRSPYEERPFYASLFGGASLVIAAAILATGWHPASELAFEGQCPAEPPRPPPEQPEPETYER